MKGKSIRVSATAGILAIKIEHIKIVNEPIGDKWLFDLSQREASSYLDPFWNQSNKEASIGNHKAANQLIESYHNFNRYVAHYKQAQEIINS